MAIVIRPTYPAPDRSRQTISHKKDADGILDVGWCEGVMSDGRPFRVEMWAQDGISMVTAFFSNVGLDGVEPAAIEDLVVSEGLVTFRPRAEKYCTAVKISDDAGNQMWSVGIVVGDEDETYVGNSVPVFPYGSGENPHSVFNRSAIQAP